MLNNKEALDYFYQSKNVSSLEFLIAQHFLDFCKARHSFFGEEDEYYQSLNKEISTLEDALDTFDNLVYPQIQKILPMDGVKKPELKLYGHGFVEDCRALLKDDKLGKYFGGAMGVLEYLESGSLLSSLLTAGIYGLGTTAALSLVTIFKRKNTLGYVDNMNIDRVYLHKERLNSFAFSLAHETTHSVYLQNSSFLDRQYSLLTNDNLICHEGTAHSVAKLVADNLEPVGGIDIFKMYSYPLTITHLLNGYHILYDKMGLPESARQYEKFRSKKDEKDGEEYSLGYSLVQLLCLEKGKGVIMKLMKDESVF